MFSKIELEYQPSFHQVHVHIPSNKIIHTEPKTHNKLKGSTNQTQNTLFYQYQRLNLQKRTKAITEQTKDFT